VNVLFSLILIQFTKKSSPPDVCGVYVISASDLKKKVPVPSILNVMVSLV